MTLVNNPPWHRWLAVALLVLMLTLVVGLFFVPMISMSLELQEEKSELLFRLQRYQRIIDRKDAVLEHVSAIKEDNSEQNLFSSRRTEALASADLQQVIKTAIASAGGQLTSTQVTPSKKEGEFIRIAVKARMTGDIDVLRSVLFQIETSVPLLVIDELDVRPERGRRNRLTRKIEPSNKLNVSFQVSSFMGKT